MALTITKTNHRWICYISFQGMINVSFLTHKPFLSFWYIVGGGDIFPQNNIDSTLKTDAIFQVLRFEDSLNINKKYILPQEML